MRRQALFVLLIGVLVFGLTSVAAAAVQLDENCTATILNRTVQLNHQGGFAIPNVPVVDGKYRVRIVCKAPNGSNTYAVSDYFVLVANGSTQVTNLVPADSSPSPVSINILVPFANPNLTSVGQMVQLNVRATLPADPSFPSVPQYRDVTLATEGTTYTSSNVKIATVTKDGTVAAVSHGQAVITARNEGAVSTVIFNIQTPIDTDGDGMPDDWEVANGLNPNDPTDAGKDLDADGLSNLQEYQLGTNPRVKDTDGDGVIDGQEVQLGTNPLLPDSDGDGLLDGQEVKLNTDPLNADTDSDGIPDGKEVKLRLNPFQPDVTTTVQGRLLGPDGNPVLGGSAIVFTYFTANSDNTGFFKIPFVPTTVGNIVVQGSGLAGDKLLSGQSSAVTPIPNGITDVGTVQLKLDAGVVFGRVLNGLNQPVAGANVVVASGPNLIGRSATSDALGNFRVSNQVSGPVVITAVDPKTLLRAKVTGMLPANGNLNLDVKLLPTGKLTGVVFGRDGKTPVGAGITVNVAGPMPDTTKTDGVGRYIFDYMPLGSYQLDAFDTDGNHGRTSINIEFTSQTQKADVTFLARGTVTVTVVDGSSTPVPNANVYLYSGSVFGGSQQGTTDSAGIFSFPGIFAGNFTLTGRSPITRLAGQKDGKIATDNQNVPVTVMLQASGSIAGTVVRHDGTTKVAGALVQLSNGLTTITASDGKYRIDFVPTGNYEVSVTDGNTGDRGRTTTGISSQDQVANGDVVMNGLGNITVLVKDGGGHAVSGAQVTVSTKTVFGGSANGVTGADGTVAFANFLAGGYHVYALNQQTGLAGAADDAVAVGQSQTTEVDLQAAGTIFGTVYGPNGVTPVPYISVRLQGQVNRTVNTDADGKFAFTGVPVNTYNVAVIDSYNNLRAFLQGVPLQTDGQSVPADLTLIGVGTVTGTVFNPDQTPVPGIGVTLNSYAPGYAHGINGQTDVNGVYTIAQVPVGNFTVNSSGQTATSTLFGTTDGNLPGDGQSATADIHLTETQVPITVGVSLYDANGYVYDIGQDGSILNGFRRTYAGNFGTANHGMLLDVIANGTPTRFAGQPFATKSLNGREFTLSQANVAGLNVMRKIYVPRDGYFTRYIELLTNPGTQPITVDLQLTSNIRPGTQSLPDVVVTSSGDSSFSVDTGTPDRWLVTDDQIDADPFLSNDALVVPPLGFVFDGVNGADHAQIGSYDNSLNYGLLQFGWKSITVAPGQTVGYMHFNFQQTSRVGSQLSADRLGSLAPEALGGETLPDLNAALKDLLPKWTSLKATSDGYLANFTADNTFIATAAQITTFGTEMQNLSAALDTFVTGGSTDLAQISQQATNLQTETITLRNFLQSLSNKKYCLTADANCTATVGQGAPLLANQGNGLVAPIVQLLDAATDLLDLARVRNWVPPLNAAPALPALPPLNTGAKGRVFASDGITPIAGATVSVQSTDLIFGRIYNVNSDGNGNYLLNSILRDSGDSVAVPFENFKVQAIHPLSKIQTPPITVIPNESTLFGEQDISFTNTGIIAGIVRRANGPVVTLGYVSVNGDGLAAGPAFPQIQIDGSYNVNGVPPGPYSMVATIPHPQGTPLYGTSSTTVTAGNTAAGDIFIQPTGAISGTIKRTDNSTVPNLPVNLHGDNFARYTTTDTGGKFTFTDVPVGRFSIDAFDAEANSADSQVADVSADVTTPKNLTLTFGGSVVGTVFNPDNSAAQGLTVTLIGPSGTLSTTTGTDGKYRFDHVTPGNISVSSSDPNTGFRGGNAGSFGLAGQTLTLNINLYTNGTVTGTVFQSDGVTALANAQVTIYAPGPLGTKTINAGADGKFTFLGVPIGSFTLEGNNLANGDRGRATNQVSTNGETRTVNVRMNGVGTVVVSVQDANNNVVNTAHVQIYGQGQFGGYQTGDTIGGTITFTNFLAGGVVVYATDSLTGLAGNMNATLVANQSLPVLVKLQAAGTVTGVVQITVNNVTTPVAGATVRLFQSGYSFQRQTTAAADGSYTFTSVPLGSYTLDSLDSQSRVRARSKTFSINSNGDLALINLDFIGVGTVSGQVTDPNNSASPANIPVQLRSLNPDIGGYLNTTTDASGKYTISGVPVGNFTVNATDSSRGFLGDASGRLDNDGQTVPADIHLINNAINLPTNLYDLNGFLFDMQQNGMMGYGQANQFYGNGGTDRGGFQLALIDSQSNTAAFTGSSIGAKEVGGRQIDIRQNNLAGIDVTRKIFVPEDGYFVRYVEVLSNPTTDPITVDLQITINQYCYNYPYGGNCSVYATSSGDTTFSLTDPNGADQWVVFQPGNPTDPFRIGYPGTLGYVFDGPLALDHADDATVTQPASNYQVEKVTWKSITIPAGGKVSYMHFGVQHVNGDAAQASADRLNQLPPEALVGLSGDDISTIQNFAVPISGVSDVPPLPVTNGTVSGIVYGGDSATPVPSAEVQYTSSLKEFARTRYVSTDVNGAYTLAGSVAQRLAVPVADFTVMAKAPSLSNFFSPQATGAFGVGQTSATQNLMFTNAGTLKGVVRLNDGTPLTAGGQVYASGINVSASVYSNMDGTGGYVYPVLPVGSFNLQATANVPFGSVTGYSNNVKVVAGQLNTSDIIFPILGSVSGTVFNGAGVAVPNTFINLYNNLLYWQGNTDASGKFNFQNVPGGTYTLRTYEPNSGIYITKTVVVLSGQAVTQDLMMVGLGTVMVQVNSAGGTPVQNSYIYSVTPTGSLQTGYGYTDSAGKITANNFPTGSFGIRAYDQNFVFYTDVPVNLTTNGETKSVVITLPATGVINGAVKQPDGTPIGSNRVTITDNVNYSASTTTDANGLYTFTQVPATGSKLTLRSTNPSPNDTSLYRSLTTTALDTNGETLTLDLVMPALATLHVLVQNQDQTPFGDVNVYVQDPYHGRRNVGKTDTTTGLLDVPNVAEGNVTVQGYTVANNTYLGSVGVTVQPADNGKTVNATLTAPFTSVVVKGVVYAGDGTTPVYRSYVEVVDTSNTSISAIYTSADGSYSLTLPRVSNSGFSVRAHSPQNFDVYASATNQATQDGQTITINLTIPASIVYGVVKYSDGSAVNSPSVFAHYRSANGNLSTQYAQTQGNGNYQLIGLPVGSVVILAQDGNSGLVTTASLNIAATTSTINQDATLAADGSIHGTITNGNGYVVVTAANAPFSYYRYAYYNTGSTYSLTHIPIGNFTLQAADYNRDIFQNVPGTLVNAGDNVQVDATIQGLGSITGTLVQNGSPVANSSVSVQSFDGQGPFGSWGSSASTDANGHFTLSEVPFGTVRVSSNNVPYAYLEQILTSANSPLDFQIDATDTSLFATFNTNLDGNDGYRYGLNCNGYLFNGTPLGGGVSNVFGEVLHTRINGNSAGCVGSSAGVEANGRQLVIGHQNIGGLTTLRKVFSPVQGGYVRMMDILTNNTASDIKTTFAQFSSLNSGVNTGVEVSAASTNYTYYVTNNGTFTTYPPAGFVIAGAGAFAGTAPQASVTIPKDDSTDNYINHSWELTIPAGQTVIFLNYAVAASDVSTATSRASSLAAGADAHQFENMTDQEKALVINFTVPHI